MYAKEYIENRVSYDTYNLFKKLWEDNGFPLRNLVRRPRALSSMAVAFWDKEFNLQLPDYSSMVSYLESDLFNFMKKSIYYAVRNHSPIPLEVVISSSSIGINCFHQGTTHMDMAVSDNWDFIIHRDPGFFSKVDISIPLYDKTPDEVNIILNNSFRDIMDNFFKSLDRLNVDSVTDSLATYYTSDGPVHFRISTEKVDAFSARSGPFSV